MTKNLWITKSKIIFQLQWYNIKQNVINRPKLSWKNIHLSKILDIFHHLNAWKTTVWLYAESVAFFSKNKFIVRSTYFCLLWNVWSEKTPTPFSFDHFENFFFLICTLCCIIRFFFPLNSFKGPKQKKKRCRKFASYWFR